MPAALLPRPGSDRVRVLVTGGAGFIGSHVVDAVRAAGHEPIVYDVRRSPWHGSDVAQIRGSLLDPKQLAKALAGCEAVAHLAAAADVGEVAKEPAWAEELNCRGTLNVLEAARAAGIKRVVYASTIWVYDGAQGDEVDEETPLGAPAHLYTATKLAGEHYCRSYATLYDLEPTILRFGIPYGPRARPAAVIPAFTNKALAGEALTIAGTGEQTRRFVYVEDLADGVARALAPAAAGRTYNLVSDEDTSVVQIAEAVRGAVGPVEVTHGPGRAGDFKGAVVCGARAREELGWTARTPFSEGVRRYVEWHREQTAPVPARARLRPALAALALPALVLGLLTVAMLAGFRPTDDERVFVTATLASAWAAFAMGGEGSRGATWAGAVLLALALVIEPVRHGIGLTQVNRELPLLLVVGALAGVGAAAGGRRALAPSDA